MSTKKNKKKKQHNKYLLLTSLSFQMGLTIYLGSYLGKELDSRSADENKFFTIVFVLLSIAIAFYMFLKQINKIDND